MAAKVERLAFSVNEAAESAGCGPYELLSRAVELGIQVYTYLPEGSMAVTVDRRYVQGELPFGLITESILRWQQMFSYPCIIGFLLDTTDCLNIVQQRRSGRTFFEWGVVIAGKEAPVKVHASDNEGLFLICMPPPSANPDAHSGEGWEEDFKLSEPVLNPPWAMGPQPYYLIPQLCFGAYPAGLEVRPDYSQLRIPRPREVALHPDHLFLLKEGMEQLGLQSLPSARIQRNAASARVGTAEVAETLGARIASAEIQGEEGGTAVLASQPERAYEKTGLSRDIHFAEIELKDYWPYWLRGFIQAATREWTSWRKADGVTQTKEDRERFKLALLRLNNDHAGRLLEVAEAVSCVTMLSPLWARHWGAKEERPHSPSTPVTAELLEMIAAAEAIKDYLDQTGQTPSKKEIRAWLERQWYHSFSAGQLKIATDLLYDVPKKSNKKGLKKAVKKQ